MTRDDTLTCVHEPFGDAFYYGPERLSERYEKDEKERIESGFGDSTYKTILDRIEREGSEVRSFLPSVTVLVDEPSTFSSVIIHLAMMIHIIEHMHYLYRETKNLATSPLLSYLLLSLRFFLVSSTTLPTYLNSTRSKATID